MITREEFHEYCKDKRIAILGNSRIILKEKLGDHIDSHQIVLRMNMGYPKPDLHSLIGRRTDIWSAAMADQTKQRHFHGLFKDRKFTLWPWYDLSTMIAEIRENTYAFPPAFYKEILGECGSIPSSGCLIVNYFIRHIEYEALTVAGFDFFKTPNFHRSEIVTAHHQPRKEEDFMVPVLKKSRGVSWIR